MADNVAITEGSGKNIATDDVQVDGAHTQGQVQFMKLVDGTLNGTASIRVDIGAKANALRVAPASDITDATYIGDIKFGESLPAGTNNIGDVDILTVPAPLNLTGGGVEASALRVTIANDSTGVLSIDDNGGSITVDGAVTANAGTNLNTSALALEGGGNLATIAGDTTAIQVAVEIMDDWDGVHASPASSDGVQIMGAAYSTGLPADVGADADAARICTDRFGRVLAGLMPQNFQVTFTSANATAAAPVKVKTASRKMYILSLVVSVDTAMSVQFQDDTGPTVLIEQLYLAANGGAHLTWPPEAPLVVNTNEDFDVLASVAGNISVTITGYLAI